MVPVVILSFASWLTASLFLCLRPCSSVCERSCAIVALAASSCSWRLWPAEVAAFEMVEDAALNVEEMAD